MNFTNVKRNHEGYSDPTAYGAFKEIDHEYEDFRKLLRTILYICQVAGFRIEGRIVLVNEKTGKIWR